MNSDFYWNIYQQLLVIWKIIDGVSGIPNDMSAAISSALLETKLALTYQIEKEPAVPTATLTEFESE